MSKNPICTIELATGGAICLELYPQKAPNTVANFISLANGGFYDGTIFHRVIAGFMIQGGDPQGSGMGGPGYSIRGEFAANGFTQNDITHKPGVISMARTADKNSAGSQFFICVANTPHLDGQYAAFGAADEAGTAVAVALSQVPTGAMDRPLEDVAIKTVRVDTKGEDYARPVKA